MRDRVKGMLLGTFIGDALGMPVETFSAKKIADTYGRVVDYHKPDGHKWFNGEESGTYTDDTQLTIAVVKGMIENPLDMDAQAKYHIEAFKESTKGWGNSTRHSVRRVANGVHWSNSAEPPTESGRGTGGGNGVPMKISPVGAYIWQNANNKELIQKSIEFIVKLSQMTHGTSISISAGLVQAFAIYRCFSSDEGKLDNGKFAKTCLMASELGKNYLPDTVNDDLTLRLTDLYDDLTLRLTDLYNSDGMTDHQIIEQFGGGSCYCYNSIPFTHAFFLRNPSSVNSLFDCISAGGDADSNGSMLGAMLGALNGVKVFPDYLISGLKNPEIVLDLSEQFCDSLGIE